MSSFYSLNLNSKIKALVPSASPLAPPLRWRPRFGLYRVGRCHESARRSHALSASRRCWPATRSTTRWSGGGQSEMLSHTNASSSAFSASHVTHLAEVQDEAVSFVEAAPGQLHLLGTDVAFPLDLVQPVHGPRTLRPPEARIHATLLSDR